MSEPDYIYDPDDWEWTEEFGKKDDLAENVEVIEGDVKRFCTLVKGPDKFCTRVGHEYRWFDNEADARAAAGLPERELL